MEHSKEFYESVIRIIDYLGNDKWDVTPETGVELAGDYWPEIGRMFKEDRHLGWFDNGQFHINKRPLLASLKKDCEHEIEKRDKAENDRNLANEESVCNIKYGKYGLYTAIAAIIISLVALALEIEERLG